MADLTKAALADWAAHALAPSAHVVSEDLWCFAAVTTVTHTTHERYVVDAGPQAVKPTEFRRVNTTLGNLKTALAGPYRSFAHAEYVHRYLAEFAYRFNRRYDFPHGASPYPRSHANRATAPTHALLADAGN